VKGHRVTLYVKSVRTVVGTEEWGRWGFVGGAGARSGTRLLPDYKVYSEAKYESVLPDNQKKVVEMVEEIARKHGFEVEVVDVAKKKGLKIKTFPTLITDTGEKIEGDISKDQIESFLAKTA